MRKKISKISIFLITALILLNFSVVYRSGNSFIFKSNQAFAADAGGGGAAPNQACFVGVKQNTGTDAKYWCGDCQKWYIYNQTGDGHCTRPLNN